MFNNLKKTKMKTLKKFECASAKVTLVMHDIKNAEVPKLYSVIETPKRKNAKWHREEKFFAFSDEANKHFIWLVQFWCK